ncbi:MAG: transposase [Planctomycetaceae bacterium]|nr:transposase [Planctomycetaceae bacterium]
MSIVLDNASYPRCKKVTELAKELKIELVFLTPYRPHLNWIERLWRFGRSEAFYCRYYERFVDFKNALQNCLGNLGSKYDKRMKT